jgi:hypothetical protein
MHLTLVFSYYSVLVTVESEVEDDMNKAYIKLRAALSEGMTAICFFN